MKIESSERRYHKASTKTLINDKMKVLEDFDVCNRRDENMRKKLEQAIANKPDKDAREVLDYYCRPIIQAKINSWT